MISLLCGLPSADRLYNFGAAQARREARHGRSIQADRVARYLAWRNIGLGESRDLPAAEPPPKGAEPPPNNDCGKTRRGTSHGRLSLGTPAGADQPGGNRSWGCRVDGRSQRYSRLYVSSPSGSCLSPLIWDIVPRVIQAATSALQRGPAKY